MTEHPDLTRPHPEPAPAAVYGMLVVLGVVLGIVGGFEHGWYLGPVPVGAVGCVLALFAALYTMGRLSGGKLGAFLPGGAWAVVTLLLATQRTEGDLIVQADAAGQWYLYGGMAALVLAVLLAPSGSGSWLLNPYTMGKNRP